MRDRPTDELLRLVGEERARHGAEVVAAAEEELATRAEAKEEASARRAKIVGRVCALLGLPLSLLSAVFVVSSADAPGSASGIIFGNWTLVTGVVGGMQFVVGLLLFFGGLQFRRLQEPGRKKLLVALRILQIYIVVFSVVFVLDVALEVGAWPGLIPLVVIAVASGVFYYWLLQLAVRYFRSSIICRICENSTIAA